MSKSGSKIIIGGTRGDQLKGGSGADVVNGMGGDDRIDAGAGDDLIDGGTGNDRIDGGSGDDTVLGGTGNDDVDGGSGADFVDGGSGDDEVDGGSGNDTVLGGEGNDEVDGGEGEDAVDGGVGNDEVDGGEGNDTVNGGAGHDEVDGGSGNDVVNGGSGNDRVDAGSGHDTAVYVLGENVGARDVYDGGSGTDTLQLVLTRAEWMSPAVQAEIARYLVFLDRFSGHDRGHDDHDHRDDDDDRNGRDDHSGRGRDDNDRDCDDDQDNGHDSGHGHNGAFTFSFGLTVSDFENLSVIVDGVALDPRDSAVTLVNDVMAAGEETVSISVDVLANDSVPDLIATLTNTQPSHGSVSLTRTSGAPATADTARFVYTPDAAHWQYLAAGETATDTFTYTVTDSDGDTRTATVTVTITGANDAPTISAAVSAGAVVEGGVVVASGEIAFDDADLRDGHTVSSAADGAGYLGTFTTSMIDDGAGDGAGSVSWSFAVDDAAIQYLAAGEVVSQTYTVSVDDGQGGTVSQTVTVTITGTNDGPTITTATTAGVVAEDGVVAASGQIAFADIDLRDSHTATSTADGAGYLGTFTTTVADDGAGDGAGSLTWDFTVDNAAVQYLAAGETVTQTYTVTVDDGNGGTASQTVTVTITGANDGPTIATTTAAGAVVEDGAVAASGEIAFADIDLRDGHTVSSAADGAGYLGSFTALMTDDGAGDGAGSVAWDFSVDNAAIQYLAAGETVTQSYTVTVDDGNGGTVSQTVSVTITGTNDAPVITTADVQGGVSEAEPVTGVPAATTPVVLDIETNDAFATAQVINRADMRIAPNSNLADPTDPSVRIQGAISTSADQDVFRIDLQPGETLTLDIDFAGIIPGVGGLDSFIFLYDAAGNLVNFNDDSSTAAGGGGSASTQDSFLQFVVSSGGTYYIVVRDFDQFGQSSAGTYALNVSVDSQNLQLTDSGSMTFADVDLRDGHTVSVAAQGAGYLGGLTAVVSDPSTGDGAGAVRWNFSVSNAAVQFLAAGETLTQSYVVTVNDGQGGTASETVTVTITGENDAPTISTAFSSGQIGENAALSASGVIAFDDVDLIDVHSVSSTADGAGYVGVFNASVSDPATGAGAGEITWTFDASDSELQYLAAGQTLLQRYIVTIADGNGGTTQQLVNITITGSNDAPTITSAVSNGAVVEDGMVSVDGAVAFADVDLRDGHTVAGTADNAGYLGTFTTSLTDDGAGDGAGSVSWSFAVDNAAIQYLAAGETLTQTYTITINDGQGGTVSQPVTVTITGTNDAPVVQDVSAAATEDGTPVTAAFSADDADSDDDAGSLTYVVTSAPSEGSVVNNGDGTFSFNPGADFQNLAAGETRDVAFGYDAIDSHGAATPGSVTITVTGSNDAPVTRDVEMGGSAVGAGFPLVFGGYYSYYAYNDQSGQVIFSLSDTDGDGVPDAPGSVSELAGNQTGYDYNYGLAVMDIDGDGDVDVVAANQEGIVSYTNVGDTNGDGAADFVRSVVHSGFVGYDVAVADLDGDGRLDVVASQYGALTELRNTGDANGDGLANDFTSRSVNTGSQGYGYGVTAADMNGDGLTDIVVANYYSGPNQILLNQGDTDGDGQIDYLVQDLNGPYNDNGLGVDTGDLDGDGDLDLLFSRWSGQNEVIYINDGDTDGDGQINFRTIELPTGGSTLESELIDIDGDGDLDVVTSENNGDARILYNDGDTDSDGLVDFSMQSVTGAYSNYGLAVGDVDGDGDLDIVYPSLSDNASVYLQNQGDTDGDGQLNFISVPLTGVDTSWDAEFTQIGGSGGGSGAYEDGPSVTGSFDGDDIDSDDDAASLTYTITSAPAEGSVVNNGDGTFSFQPGQDFQDLGLGEIRVVNFTYTATDAHGVVSSPSTVTIRVAGTNDAPVATLDSATTAEETSVTIDVLANDSDIDGDLLVVSHVNGVNIAVNGVVALGDGASVRLNADGTLTYMPAANATGLRSFAYTVTDGLGGAITATVEVSLTPVNDAPTANADSGSTDEDASVILSASSLLGNDTDPDGDVLTISSVSAVSAHGASVTINAAGDVVYDPAGSASLQALTRGQQATDTFTYVVTDASGATSTATVTITVDGRLEAPVANPDTVTVTENGTVAGNVVANDTVTGSTDNSGNVLTNGSFEQGNPVSPGGINYPASLPGWTSVQGSFEVWGTGFQGNTASDGVAFLELDNGGGQDAYSSNLTTDVGREYTLDFDLAVRNGTSTVSNRVEFFVNGVSLGVFTPTSTSFSTFTVTFIGTGADVITFREPANANDGVGGLIDNLRISAAADVFVTAVNGDTGAVGDAVAGSNGGSFVVDADGDYVFTAGSDFDYLAAGQTATSSMTYTVTDDGGSDTETVTVTVTGANDAPVANADVATTNEDTSVIFDVRANDTDIDGASRTVTHINGSAIAAGGLVTLSDGGRVVMNANGTLTYTPAANANGARTFDYTISDGQGGSATSSVNLTVNPVNDRPVAVNDVASATEAGGIQNGTAGLGAAGNVLANDTDIDNAVLVVSAERRGAEGGSGVSGTVGSPLSGAYGTLLLNADGSYSYAVNETNAAVQALNTGGVLTDTFTYTMRDAAGLTDTAQLTITINGANDAPVAQNVTLQANQLGNGGFDAAQDFSGWTVSTATSGLAYPGSSTAVINRSGTVIAGDTAVAVLQFTGNVPYGYGTGQGPSITSTAFAGQAGDTVRFVYQLSSGGDYAIGTGYIRDAVTGAIVQTIFNYQTPFTGSTGVVTQDVVLTGSGNYTIDFRVGSYDATGGLYVGARLDLGFAGILRNGVGEDESFTFAASNFTAGAIDPDGGALTVVSVGASANGATVTLNANGSVLYNPAGHLDFLAAGQQLVDTFQYTLSDGRGGFSTATASITVIGKDDAPVVTHAAQDQSAAAANPFSYTLAADTFTDPDSVLTLTAALADGSPLPSWLVFDPATRTFSGTPQDAQIGHLDIKVTATGGAQSVFDVFGLDVAGAQAMGGLALSQPKGATGGNSLPAPASDDPVVLPASTDKTEQADPLVLPGHGDALLKAADAQPPVLPTLDDDAFVLPALKGLDDGPLVQPGTFDDWFTAPVGRSGPDSLFDAGDQPGAHGPQGPHMLLHDDFIDGPRAFDPWN
ncbi:VCBS domain-containing protein [Brevundimonas sp.]|uniref:VCBS domain-containing protein n=1 Tax=Brevundimonas sp. TaxID=1871086 RepID=UPI00121A612C|nr:VCBS domain-containing protein [Brevundimonas sp.]TAJ67800.1 MAG: tandem-95 repeat protein [Brevundimonas sp.]